ncbi:MAG TPA: IS1595 family transposase [Pyrinomonadaceae bacterium]|nr:IS1595 family transposase [Pyrinomonadaceae bacterium]HRK52043.1 IS1595 family transposase [Pyrinomonadaceae bacterium]
MENELPKTLQDAVKYFSDESTCINFVASLRWADGVPVCPKCEANQTSFISTRNVWKCKACKKQFSVKVGTIFEDSAIKLDKWLVAIWLIANAKNGISSYELHRAIGITQKSAWFVLHRIRTAMQVGSIEKLSGTVEADETYIGGSAKNMHKAKRERFKMKGGRRDHKTAVLGMVERKGRVRAKVIKNNRGGTLVPLVRENVAEGSELYTDQWEAYELLASDYIHEAVNHSIEYVRGNIHTNSIENFWSLMKRTIRGTYVSVAPEHLQKYVEEQSFRYNERKGNDQLRFIGVLRSISGKRLTYEQLIGYQISWS